MDAFLREGTSLFSLDHSCPHMFEVVTVMLNWTTLCGPQRRDLVLWVFRGCLFMVTLERMKGQYKERGDKGTRRHEQT